MYCLFTHHWVLSPAGGTFVVVIEFSMAGVNLPVKMGNKLLHSAVIFCEIILNFSMVVNYYQWLLNNLFAFHHIVWLRENEHNIVNLRERWLP